jgi:hypothetical protein
VFSELPTVCRNRFEIVNLFLYSVRVLLREFLVFPVLDICLALRRGIRNGFIALGVKRMVVANLF